MRFLYFLIVLISFSAHSIEHKFSVGGGFNFNYPKTDEDLGDFEEVVSINLVVGSRSEFVFNEQWSLRTGLNLGEKSAKLEYDKTGFEGDFTIKVIYLSVPVEAQYRINKDIALIGGYVLDQRINEYCNVSGDINDCSLTEDAKSIVHNASLGVLVTGSEKFDVEINYQYSISDVFEDLKLHTLQAMAFYKF